MIKVMGRCSAGVEYCLKIACLEECFSFAEAEPLFKVVSLTVSSVFTVICHCTLKAIILP